MNYFNNHLWKKNLRKNLTLGKNIKNAENIKNAKKTQKKIKNAKIGDGDLDQINLVTNKGFAPERTQHFVKK